MILISGYRNIRCAKVIQVEQKQLKYHELQPGAAEGFVCLLDGVLRHFQQYFIYIVAVSFIGGGNRRTWRKPPTCRKSLKTLSHNGVHLALVEIRTHYIRGDRH